MSTNPSRNERNDAKCLDSISQWLNSSLFASRIEDLMNDFHIPGIALAIVEGTDISSRSFGGACISPKKKCTPNTIFDIASCSKALTTICAAIIVEDRNNAIRNWETPIASVLKDDFVMAEKEATKTITIEDVLSHRTGLPGHDASILGTRARCPDTARSVTRNLRNLAINRLVGSTYQYSNMMYTVATHWIESISNLSFSSFLRENIFDKLGMSSTFLGPTEVFAAGKEDFLSTPYYFKDGSYHATDHQEAPGSQGAGSIFSSVNDFAKFIRAMINRSSPITDAIYQALTKPRIMLNPKANLQDFYEQKSGVAYGLGWDLKYYRGVQIIAHNGIEAGYGSRMFFIPQHGVGAIIVGNSEGAHDLSLIIQHEITDRVLQVPEDQRSDTARIRLKIFAAQEARMAKNVDRNAERLMAAKDTTTIPISAYCGTYSNAGYHEVTVQEKDRMLFIDGSDRAMPFMMPLEHVTGDNVFRGYWTEAEGDENVVSVAFRLDTHKNVSAIGIDFEPSLGKNCLIWFERL